MSAVAPVLVGGTALAAAFDLRTRRIPNIICIALLVAAIAIDAPHGAFAVFGALAAAVVAFALATAAFARGWFGGGDVKLIAASCALVGPSASIVFVLDVLVAGALLALLTAAHRRRLRLLLSTTLFAATGGAPASSLRLPYGVAIAAGAAAFALAPALRLP